MDNILCGDDINLYLICGTTNFNNNIGGLKVIDLRNSSTWNKSASTPLYVVAQYTTSNCDLGRPAFLQ